MTKQITSETRNDNTRSKQQEQETGEKQNKTETAQLTNTKKNPTNSEAKVITKL